LLGEDHVGKLLLVTPVLSAVYDEMLAWASAPPLAHAANQWVRAFLDRTGRFPQEDPVAATRLTVAWEDALCRGGLARRLLTGFSDPAERQLGQMVAVAHRGVFSFDRVGVHCLLHDLVSGAAFVLVAGDTIARGVVDDNLGALCQARIVGAPDGCSMLPGVVFHQADATSCIEQVVQHAREQGMTADALCDALLHMEFALRTMSRGRPALAYRPEALTPQRADVPAPWRKKRPSRGGVV
jgi:hypothetical protein